MLNTWPKPQSRKAAPTGPCLTAHPVAAWTRTPGVTALSVSRESELAAAIRVALRLRRLDVLMGGLLPGSAPERGFGDPRSHSG